MKRKSADRSWWRRVTRRRFSVTYIDTAEFTGYITLLNIDEVREPLTVRFKDRWLCVADQGFAWLQHFPKDTQYTLTTMFDAEGKIVEWYIDICKQHGIDEHGIPWYDDLYLDIVVVPPRETWIIDAEELDEALHQGKVSQAEYDLAWHEANRLLAEIEQGAFKLLEMFEAHLFMVRYQ